VAKAALDGGVRLNIQTTQGNDEAQVILEALRKIQESDELRSEATTNPEATMDRMGLSGVARHAVAFGIAGMLVAPGMVRVQGFWGG
jgi:hypothetical protein